MAVAPTIMENYAVAPTYGTTFVENYAQPMSVAPTYGANIMAAPTVGFGTATMAAPTIL
jgi:hypothetical protein